MYGNPISVSVRRRTERTISDGASAQGRLTPPALTDLIVNVSVDEVPAEPQVFVLLRRRPDAAARLRRRTLLLSENNRLCGAAY